jgi:hypothetical protein
MLLVFFQNLNPILQAFFPGVFFHFKCLLWVVSSLILERAECVQNRSTSDVRRIFQLVESVGIFPLFPSVIIQTLLREIVKAQQDEASKNITTCFTYLNFFNVLNCLCW